MILGLNVGQTCKSSLEFLSGLRHASLNLGAIAAERDCTSARGVSRPLQVAGWPSYAAQ
jgi:hypothetical protein